MKITIEFDDDGNLIDVDTGAITVTETEVASYKKLWHNEECFAFLDVSHGPSCYDRDGKFVCEVQHLRFQFFDMNKVKAAKMNKVKHD
jgi:hypothetical protein